MVADIGVFPGGFSAVALRVPGGVGLLNVPLLFFLSQADSRAAIGVVNGSGDDVGRDLVFDEGDTVAQQQLALLQPL